MPELRFVEWNGSALVPMTVLEAGSRAELARNVNTNPSFGTNVSGYGRVTGTNGVATIERVAEPGPAGAIGFGRVSWTTGNTGAGGFNCIPALTPAQVAVGDRYALQAMIRTNRARSVNFGGYYKLGNSIVGPAAVQTTHALPAETWTPVGQVLPVATVAADNVYLYCYFTGVATMAGDRMDFDLVMVEKGSTITPYYDGDSPAGDTFRHEWLGTPHASASVRRDVRGGALKPFVV